MWRQLHAYKVARRRKPRTFVDLAKGARGDWQTIPLVYCLFGCCLPVDVFRARPVAVSVVSRVHRSGCCRYRKKDYRVLTIGLRDKVHVVLGGKARQSARGKRDKVHVKN